MSKQDELWEKALVKDREYTGSELADIEEILAKAKQHFEQKVAKHLFEYVEGNYSTVLMAKELGLSLMDFHQVCLGIAKLWGPEQKKLDKSDSISSVDELEKFYSWYGNRLDKPELREKQLAIDNILRNIRDAGWIACNKNGSVPEVYDARNKILALIPDVEEAKKQERERILTLLESYPLNQLQQFPTRVEIEQALKEEK